MVHYCAAADVKGMTRLTYDKLGLANDAALTTFIESLISEAESRIDGVCGVPDGFFRAGGLTVTEELYDGDGDEDLYLNYAPIVSVTSLYENTASLTAPASWVQRTEGPGSGTSFVKYAREGRLHFYDHIPGYGVQNVKVTYVAGYSAVPGVVARIAKDLAANALRGILHRQMDPTQITSLIMNGGDVKSLLSDDMSLNMDQLRALTPYIQVKVSAG